MSESLITYPCEFPIKIMGLATPEFEGVVIAILNQHVTKLGEGAIRSKLSQNQKYVAITATVQAESKAHLDGIYQALSTHEQVMVVL